MKNLLLTFLLTLLLSACAFTAQKYDHNEYQMLAYFVVSAEEINKSCSGDGSKVKMLLPTLKYDARVLELYTEFTPKNAEVHNVAKILHEDITQLQTYYTTKTHNKTYCKIKTNLIIKKATRILEAVGKKTR